MTLPTLPNCLQNFGVTCGGAELHTELNKIIPNNREMLLRDNYK
jgi:hypothetical protein